MSRQEDERKEGVRVSVCAAAPVVPKNEMKVMDWSFWNSRLDILVCRIYHSFQRSSDSDTIGTIKKHLD